MRSFKRRAKIVATLGVYTSDVETIKRLIRQGLNVARINMGYGTHEERASLVTNIRKASKSVGREVAILLDLQGAKHRIGHLAEPLEAKKGETWAVGFMDKIGKLTDYKNRYIPICSKFLIKDCKVGHRVFVDDGLVIGEVSKKEKDYLELTITTSGFIKGNKRIDLPDSLLSQTFFTDKDMKDLDFGLIHDVDYIALSYVKSAENVLEVKSILKEKGAEHIPVIAKIGNKLAVDNMEQIFEAADAIMLTRGDLAAELGNHAVPSVQREVIGRCNQLGIPVITATQILESMTHNPSPTRAEASDVANAVWDGTDALMLSAETASGKYPIEAVAMMDKIIEEAERTPKKRPFFRGIDVPSVSDATMIAAVSIAEKVEAQRILSITKTGRSTLAMTHFRPANSVLGVTNSLGILRKMCLYWGVSPFFLEDFEDSNSYNEEMIIDMVKRECNLNNGDKIVVVFGDDNLFEEGYSNYITTKTIA